MLLGKWSYHFSQVERVVFELRPEGRKEVGCADLSGKST